MMNTGITLNQLTAEPALALSLPAGNKESGAEGFESFAESLDKELLGKPDETLVSSESALNGKQEQPAEASEEAQNEPAVPVKPENPHISAVCIKLMPKKTAKSAEEAEENPESFGTQIFTGAEIPFVNLNVTDFTEEAEMQGYAIEELQILTENKAQTQKVSENPENTQNPQESTSQQKFTAESKNISGKAETAGTEKAQINLKAQIAEANADPESKNAGNTAKLQVFADAEAEIKQTAAAELTGKLAESNPESISKAVNEQNLVPGNAAQSAVQSAEAFRKPEKSGNHTQVVSENPENASETEKSVNEWLGKIKVVHENSSHSESGLKQNQNQGGGKLLKQEASEAQKAFEATPKAHLNIKAETKEFGELLKNAKAVQEEKGGNENAPQIAYKPEMMVLPQVNADSEEVFLPNSQIEKFTAEITARLETLQDGTTTFEMTLNPENLGKIAVKLILKAGNLSVQITAEKAGTALLLQNTHDKLTHVLERSGAKLENVQVVVENAENKDDYSEQRQGGSQKRGYEDNREENGEQGDENAISFADLIASA